MTKDTVNIHGKEYETVASRVQRFRNEYKSDLSIVTDIISADDKTVVMKASILQGEKVIATGHAEENRASSSINRTSALENCETSAIGRALAAFGLAGTEFASADEVAQAIHQQTNTASYTGAPRTDAKPQLYGEASDKQKETISKHLSMMGTPLEDQKEYLIHEYGVDFPLSKQVASEVIDDLFATKGSARQTA